MKEGDGMTTLGLAIFFIIVFVVSKFAELHGDSKFYKSLKTQNRGIIVSNCVDLNMSNECFKNNSFFQLKNSGRNPCEIEVIEYVRYSDVQDYYFQR